MGKRSRQAGAPSGRETHELKETVQAAGGWRPSVEMLSCISSLIREMEFALGVVASAGDDVRLTQRFVALRGSGLVTDAAPGLSEADYDTCVLAVENHFLQSGYTLESIRAAMVGLTQPSHAEDTTKDNSDVQSPEEQSETKDDKPRASASPTQKDDDQAAVNQADKKL
eukprot:s10286_g1.t1